MPRSARCRGTCRGTSIVGDHKATVILWHRRVCSPHTPCHSHLAILPVPCAICRALPGSLLSFSKVGCRGAAGCWARRRRSCGCKGCSTPMPTPPALGCTPPPCCTPTARSKRQKRRRIPELAATTAGKFSPEKGLAGAGSRPGRYGEAAGAAGPVAAHGWSCAASSTGARSPHCIGDTPEPPGAKTPRAPAGGRSHGRGAGTSLGAPKAPRTRQLGSAPQGAPHPRGEGPTSLGETLPAPQPPAPASTSIPAGCPLMPSGRSTARAAPGHGGALRIVPLAGTAPLPAPGHGGEVAPCRASPRPAAPSPPGDSRTSGSGTGTGSGGRARGARPAEPAALRHRGETCWGARADTHRRSGAMRAGRCGGTRAGAAAAPAPPGSRAAAPRSSAHRREAPPTAPPTELAPPRPPRGLRGGVLAPDGSRRAPPWR